MPSAPSLRLATVSQLGHVLKSARKTKALTQTDIAHRLGLSQNRVSFLETNPDALSAKQLLTWCAALGLELRIGEIGEQPRGADAVAW